MLGAAVRSAQRLIWLVCLAGVLAAATPSLAWAQDGACSQLEAPREFALCEAARAAASEHGEASIEHVRLLLDLSDGVCDLRMARGFAEQAIRAAGLIVPAHPRVHAQAFQAIGTLWYLDGDLAASESALRASLDQHDASFTRRLLGDVARDRGQFSASIRELDRAVQLAISSLQRAPARARADRRLGWLVNALTSRAVTKRMRGDLVGARHDADAAVAVLQVEVAAMGNAHANLNHPVPPLGLSNRWALADALLQVGEIAELSGNIDEAEAAYNGVIELEIRDPQLEGDLHMNRAALHSEFGDPRVARVHYRAAAVAFRRVLRRGVGCGTDARGPEEDLGWAYTQLADTASRLGRHVRADRLLNLADELRTTGLAVSASNLDWLYMARAAHALRTGRLHEAERRVDQALRQRLDRYGSMHRHTGASRGLRGRILIDSGRLVEGMSELLAAERVRVGLVRVAFRGLSERRGFRHLAVTPRWIDSMLPMVAGDNGQRNLVVQVFDAQVQARGLAFDEVSQRRRLVAEASTDPAIRAAYEGLVRANAALAASAFGDGGDSDSLDLLQARVETADTALAGLLRNRRDTTGLGAEDVLAALPPGSALVSYVRASPNGADRYYVFVARHDPPVVRLVDLGPAVPIDAQVERWRAAVKAGANSDNQLSFLGDPGSTLIAYLEVAAELRQAIYDPLVDAIGDAVDVLVVPDSALNFVSFAALSVGDEFLVEGGKRFHYLATEREVVADATSPSSHGVLLVGDPAFRRLRSGDRTALAGASTTTSTAGNGVPEGLDLPRLAATRAEIRRVAELWGESAGGTVRFVGRDALCEFPEAEASIALQGDCASEAIFRSAAVGKKIVHLATHGFFRPPAIPIATSSFRQPGAAALEDPTTVSAIALAGALNSADSPSTDNGVLTASEIALLDLGGIEWAVLSACETGLGAAEAGEGVFGLRRSFAVAGARTVIMSLWFVNDAATSRWIELLYRQRLLGRLTTIEAMNRATQAFLAERRAAGQSVHPYYWAAFVAAGNWQ